MDTEKNNLSLKWDLCGQTKLNLNLEGVEKMWGSVQVNCNTTREAIKHKKIDIIVQYLLKVSDLVEKVKQSITIFFANNNFHFSVGVQPKVLKG